jgi:hypothetical protein
MAYWQGLPRSHCSSRRRLSQTSKSNSTFETTIPALLVDGTYWPLMGPPLSSQGINEDEDYMREYITAASKFIKGDKTMFTDFVQICLWAKLVGGLFGTRGLAPAIIPQGGMIPYECYKQRNTGSLHFEIYRKWVVCHRRNWGWNPKSRSDFGSPYSLPGFENCDVRLFRRFPKRHGNWGL